MVTFTLIHGGGGSAWDWHLVSAELRERGHDPVAVDLPSDEESAGWWEYADAVVHAVGDRSDVVVVAHSLGGFTAPLVCVRIPVDLLVLVAAMIPAPGELLADWWANTAYEESAYDDVFYHDVAPVSAEARRRERDEVARAMRGRGPSKPGRTRRRGTSSAATTACSERRGRAATHASASVSTPTRWTAAITSASAGRASWPSGSWPTSRLAERRQGELDGVVEGHSAAFRPKGVGVPPRCARAPPM